MNNTIVKQGVCYGLYDGDEIIGFCGPVMHFPTTYNPKIKRTQRTVILPDYQGIGLGTKLEEFVAQTLYDLGWDYICTTSSRNYIAALKRSPKWRLYNVTRYNASPQKMYGRKKGKGYGGRGKGRKVTTCSFMYKPEDAKDGKTKETNR